MAQATSLKIFETLRSGFEEKQSTLIAEAIETAMEASAGDLVTKECLKAELAQLEARLTKWMFVFWAGHTLTVVGIVIAVIKYLK